MSETSGPATPVFKAAPPAPGATPRARIDPFMRLALDLGPLMVFFGANWFFGIFPATAAFMMAFCVALVIGWQLEKRLSPLALFTGAMVMVFGGLTLILQDDLFIKIKPTITNAMLASILIAGLMFGRPLIKMVLEHAIQLPDHAWRILTWRWAGLFIVLAILNEIVWRNFDRDTWVAFKVWGVFPLTLIFAMAQAPFIMKHQIEPGTVPPDQDSGPGKPE